VGGGLVLGVGGGGGAGWGDCVQGFGGLCGEGCLWVGFLGVVVWWGVFWLLVLVWAGYVFCVYGWVFFFIFFLLFFVFLFFFFLSIVAWDLCLAFFLLVVFVVLLFFGCGNFFCPCLSFSFCFVEFGGLLCLRCGVGVVFVKW